MAIFSGRQDKSAVIRPVKFPVLKNIAQKVTSVFSLSILVQRMKQFIWTKSSNGA